MLNLKVINNLNTLESTVTSAIRHHFFMTGVSNCVHKKWHNTMA